MHRLALLFLASSAVAQPTLDAFSVLPDDLRSGPAVFDLTEASRPLRVRVAASSPGSEVDVITVSMSLHNHFGGTTVHTLPNIRTASATVEYPLPRFMEAGVYELNVAIQDVDGRFRRWTVDELADAGLPNQIEVRVTGDLYAPEVAAIEVANIDDPSMPEGTACFTFRDPSGILGYRVVAESPSGRRRTIGAFQAPVGVGPTHTFESAFTLSRGLRGDEPAEEGRWTLVEIHATDSNGTTRVFYLQDLISLELQARFWVGPVPPDPEPEVGCGGPNPVRAGRPVRVFPSATAYDARGRRVGQASHDGTLDTAGWASGTYVARPAGPDAQSCTFTVQR